LEVRNTQLLLGYSPRITLRNDEVRLGSYNRIEYMNLAADGENDNAFAELPRDFLAPRQRSVNGQISKTLWIRSWYGDNTDGGLDQTADEAYAGLKERVFAEWPLEFETDFVFEGEQIWDDGALNRGGNIGR